MSKNIKTYNEKERKKGSKNKRKRRLLKERKRKKSTPKKEAARILRRKIRRDRERVRKEMYAEYNFKNNNHIVALPPSMGVEKDEFADDFIDKAYECVNFNAGRLTIDMEKSSRIWPSAITLFCSLKQWVEMCPSKYIKKGVSRPIIASSTPIDDKVESYLQFSGFYNYVGRQSTGTNTGPLYADNEIVKIEREMKKDGYVKKDDAIYSLLKLYSSLGAQDLERIYANVFTEIFNNVLEHGISKVDQGYWSIAQLHRKTGIISVCIADNGIGIAKTLLTGPQRSIIVRNFGSDNIPEGSLIEHAMNDSISGAMDAATDVKSRIFAEDKYPRGRKRGFGLKRIKDTCARTSVAFGILSGKGYLFFDEKGQKVKCGEKDKRIFAGTMFILKIPAKQ